MGWAPKESWARADTMVPAAVTAPRMNRLVVAAVGEDMDRNLATADSALVERLLRMAAQCQSWATQQRMERLCLVASKVMSAGVPWMQRARLRRELTVADLVGYLRPLLG